MDKISEIINSSVRDIFGIEVESEVSVPSSDHGDFSTNIALVSAKEIGDSPKNIATKIKSSIEQLELFKSVEVAGPGFINIELNDLELLNLLGQATLIKPKKYQDKVVVVEYSDPNPFKVLHAGHLYQTIFGDSISRLVRVAGGQVYDVNFGGDVGRHVAITMWAILERLGGENPDKLAQVEPNKRADWLADCYAMGTKEFEERPEVADRVVELNASIYKIHQDDDQSSPLAKIYWQTRKWSYDYFEEFYASIGSGFDKYYPESQTAPSGLKIVKEQLEKGVYEKSQGAVVFKGEPYGLHTRVFINKNGLPTYEAKDIGLAIEKWNDYKFDETIIITGNDIVEYMKVVLKSLEQFEPEIARRTTHFTHGQVKLKGGVKMSSRKGNVIKAVDIIEAASLASKEVTGEVDKAVVLAAIKYAFLKQRLGPDVVYDPVESVSLQGNSGPYLQYAHVRASSILDKANYTEVVKINNLDTKERILAQKIIQYPLIVQKSVSDLMPHHVATYLYELCQEFNRFYEHNKVIGSDREPQRLELVSSYKEVLRDGLSLLNIGTPERM